MKIILVGGMFPPMQTGTAFYTLNLARKLRDHGHQVEIITLGETATSGEEYGLTVHRLQAFRLPMKGFFKHYQIASFNPANWLKMRRLVRESGAEAILLVNHYLDIAFPTILAARAARIPLVCSVGTQLQSLNPRRNKILNVLDRMIVGTLVLPFCRRLVAWDMQIRQYLLDVHGPNIDRKIDIVNYGVNGRPELLLEHRHDYSRMDYIICVGAVSEQRSFVPLVRAFALLADRFPQLKLRIIGHVYYDAALRLAEELGIGDKVEFTGEMPHDQVLEALGGGTLFFSSLTGQYVGMGTATIEAMLLGVPSVVNTPLDLLGAHTLVDYEHVVQSSYDDATKIARLLSDLLQDPALRERVGTGGRDFVANYLNWDVVACDMARVLSNVAKKKNAAA